MFKQISFLILLPAGAMLAQSTRVATLVVEADNVVSYRFDVPDVLKRGAQGMTPPVVENRGFLDYITIGDVVTVNGKPAKGNWTSMGTVLGSSPAPAAGFAIGDLAVAGTRGLCMWDLATADGSFVGRFMDGGAGTPHAVISGAGAYMGVRGQQHPAEVRPLRRASVAEDPAQRRSLGGGFYRHTFYVIPSEWPDVDASGEGPMIFHSDMTLVTTAKPARAGEVLLIRAKGLGPTRPALIPPGVRAFTAEPLEEVNAPVSVVVGGMEVEAINKVGWPGTTDRYRVDFRVPDGIAAGKVTLQLVAAWIAGAEVTIPVQ